MVKVVKVEFWGSKQIEVDLSEFEDSPLTAEEIADESMAEILASAGLNADHRVVRDD